MKDSSDSQVQRFKKVTGADEFDVPPPKGEKPGDTLTKATQFGREHLTALLLGLAVLAIFVIVQLTRSQSVAISEPIDIYTPSPTPEVVFVHVTGAVNNPGVYELIQPARVYEAIELAGGLNKDAELGPLNMAAPLSDGMQVVVGSTDSTSSLGDGAQSQSSKVNLNTADSQQLESLPGVGPVTAANIIAWRQTNGRFSAPTQLQEVDGIGAKTFARLEPYVTV